MFDQIRVHPEYSWLDIEVSRVMRLLVGGFESVDPSQAYIRSVLSDQKEADQVRAAAACALGEGYDMYEVVQDALVDAARNDPSPAVRANAINGLAGGSFRFVPDARERMASSEKTILNTLRSDSSAKVRAESLFALKLLLRRERFTDANPDARVRFASVADAVLRTEGESAEVKENARELLLQAQTKKGR